MNPKRILPLLLAAGLQVMPMLRAVLPVYVQGLAPSTWAFVLKLGAGTVALLGSHHAVSGATAIVTPYNGMTWKVCAFRNNVQYSNQLWMRRCCTIFSA